MEIYKDLTNPASKEFEKLLNSKLSKTQIEEGKIIDGKINKITDKFVFLFLKNSTKIIIIWTLKKINGKIGLMGYFHLFKAQHFNDRVSLYLIGVDPKYQSKGVTAVIFNELQQTFNNRGIVEVETNPELVENKAIQAFWKNYESKLHKRRATFTKSL